MDKYSLTCKSRSLLRVIDKELQVSTRGAGNNEISLAEIANLYEKFDAKQKSLPLAAVHNTCWTLVTMMIYEGIVNRFHNFVEKKLRNLRRAKSRYVSLHT